MGLPSRAKDERGKQRPFWISWDGTDIDGTETQARGDEHRSRTGSLGIGTRRSVQARNEGDRYGVDWPEKAVGESTALAPTGRTGPLEE
jgi:hypothetical protein